MKKGAEMELRLLGELNYEMLSKTLTVMQARPEKLDVVVCGPGGEVPLTMGIIDLLFAIQDDGGIVETTAIGEVASGSAMIVAAGSLGHRRAFARTVFGLHEPYLVDCVEDPAAARSSQKESEIMLRHFYRVLSTSTRLREEEWRKKLEGVSMLWLDAMAAYREGLIDRVV